MRILRAGAAGAACLVCYLSLGTAAAADPEACENRVNNNIDKLLECVTLEGVRSHQAALQSIADSNGGIRVSGTPGYDASVDYAAGVLEGAGYDVTLQPFTFNAFIELGEPSFAQVAPVPTDYVLDVDYNVMSQSEPGDVSGVVEAADLDLGLGNGSTSGCEPADFTGFTAGNVALLQRGACAFGLKADNAAAAGAVGVIIFNQGNSEGRTGLINGTLGNGYSGGIPVVFATYDLGVELASTPGAEVSILVDVFRGTALAMNVLAETTSGDDSNVIMAGAHLDSVNEGPGINDNGSGIAALLETAVQMAKVKPRNKVRFALWGAEESGLVGSDFYVLGNGVDGDGLSEGEIADIAAYLNFDMIGSPNFVYFVYDGDGSSFGLEGPDGSGIIESYYEDFFAARGLPFESTEISFRSDYAAFFDVGIPFGGLFTGAEGIKTDEQAAQWGGTAGDAYDPCYHLACDTFDNNSDVALDVNSDAVAASILQYAMSTEILNGKRGKGNFNLRAEQENMGRRKYR
ncbi:M28 family metallopeptidase [Yoonia sediminilitoris]|uniref:PA domain-containing protein n=1 Tax=Yoonia sediminilitoris TaxID=1286148 RepID=A0A2T6KLI4_9RHOB|nr:M28 family metallopeptidase [Yoonia sediminilitoris]PUB17044.1 PA domain-containing protein [Yoonia sediminilitoris]RCW97339.1 PA domain-containing protein [Yoonia sediminilitoris]